MEPIRMTVSELAVYAVIAQTILGFVLGLIPLAIGFAKRDRRLAFLSLLACAAGGAVLGIFLSVPLAIIFTVWILTRSRRAASDTDVPDGPSRS